jgi:hypothetical protein
VAASQAAAAEEIRTTGWFDTHSRIRFYPLEPKPEEILIEDIAHALARLCRWGGHSDNFYSVAQHSCFVAELLKARGYAVNVCLEGLLHDATEAYMSDVIRPLKREPGLMPGYVEAEAGLGKVIFERFGLVWPISSAVKEADDDLLHYEACNLFEPPLVWARNEYLPLPVMLPWGPPLAEERFLVAFEALRSRRVTLGNAVQRDVPTTEAP